MTQRRQFIKQVVCIGLGATVSKEILFANPAKNNPNTFKNYTVDNPYAHVDWKKFIQVASTSHIHVDTQERLNKAYAECGYRHLPISNYYPSAPYYPADSIYQHQFRVEQKFNVQYYGKSNKKAVTEMNGSKSNTFIKPPIHWNEIIMDKETGWYDSLPEDMQKQLPFQRGGKVFTHIPSDLITSPNAEHHNFTNSSGNMHINSLGSLYSSGTFDARNRFQTLSHGYDFGTGLTWEETFTNILDELLFEDAGGITINHPSWSHLTFEETCSMLDFDPRVLGMEIFTDGCIPEEEWSVELWDQVLRSGRRAFGFSVPDHMVNTQRPRGKNMLLVPDYTEYACLRSYRTGAFFCALHGDGLAFTRIEHKGNKLTIELNQAAEVRIIVSGKEAYAAKTEGKMTYTLPAFSNQVEYVRVEASDNTGERILSQPIRFIKK